LHQGGKLLTVADEGGSVVFGWVGEGVLYAKSTGALSAALGGSYAADLGSLVAGASTVQLFFDMSALSQFDLLARSAFVRVVLANRSSFRLITALTCADGIGSGAQRVMDILGPLATVLTEKLDFEARLLRAAPHARPLIDAKATKAQPAVEGNERNTTGAADRSRERTPLKPSRR